VSVRRGPKPRVSDEALLVGIREVLAESHFVGEGHRKVWARLKSKGLCASKKRVLRLMRENGLQSPGAPKRVLGPRSHDGRITTDMPDVMWGTDATSTMTIEDGQVAVFATVDHCTTECLGIHVAKRATRFEALEPVRQAVRHVFGGYAAGIAIDLKLRHDHGSQYVSRDFQAELKLLGIESSPSFVRAPEGNGCIERFFRTLKEQVLWLKTYRNVEELRQALIAWVKVYNENWLIEKHGHRAPSAVRQMLKGGEVAA
jgi:putative transposase